MDQKKLQTAKQVKNDEFYTQLSDIEDELRHYKDEFRGKIVFCNCDDPYESNFFKFFANNFEHLGIKKLISTSYTKSPIAGTQLSLFEVEGLKPDGKQPFKVEINEVPDNDGDGAIDLSDVQYLLKHDGNTVTPLKGNGDFRSDECVGLLRQADIIVTNPPFSLFREYIAQLMEYRKKFIIIGNKNAISYKETFDLIKANKLWTGYRGFGGGMWFYVGGDGENYDRIVDGKKLKNVPSIWFTNIDTAKRHEVMNLYKKYDPDVYPKYFNYDAIEVPKTTDIPMDYEGEMGVPITFLDKYNPEQFTIVGSSRTHGKPMSTLAERGTYSQGGPRFYLDRGNGTYLRLYDRIIITHKKPSGNNS